MNTKLRCLLLDDELPGLAYLKMLCEQFPELEVVRSFNSPKKLLEELPSLEFDLCIFDIEMPEMNGLQVANLLGNKPVIFTTAYKEYAADAFDVNAIDYITKPVKKERLQQAIAKALKQFDGNVSEKSFIQWNTDKGKTLLYIETLAFIKIAEVDSRDKVAHLIDGSNITLKNISFEKLQKLLPNDAFCRINKREMISLKSVHLFTFDEITTLVKDKKGLSIKLTLSETYRNEFLKNVNV